MIPIVSANRYAIRRDPALESTQVIAAPPEQAAALEAPSRPVRSSRRPRSAAQHVGGLSSATTANLWQARLANASPHSAQRRAETLASVRKPARTGLADDWQLKTRAHYWYFPVTSGKTFDQMAAELDGVKARGIDSIMVYPPYQGDLNGGWLGGVPVDAGRPDPKTGSMQDFRNLVDKAHRANVGTVVYLGPQNTSVTSELFQQAVKDRAQGRDTRATRTFRWANTEAEKTDLGHEQLGWAYSKEAKAWYATSWGHPAIDYARQEGVDHVAESLKPWLEAGVDGIVFDAPYVQLGATPEVKKYLMGDLPKAYGVKFRFAEGTSPEALRDEYGALGFNAGIFGNDDDNFSVIDDIRGGGATGDDLEGFLALRDQAVAKGGAAARVLVYNEDVAQHVQNGAVMIGNGVQVDILDTTGERDEANYRDWSPERRRRIDRLTETAAANPALASGADRTRLPTPSSPHHFASLRTARAADGKQQRVLGVYNMSGKAETVTVDLTGSGVRLGQTPRELYRGEDAPRIGANTYRIQLPAHGFAFLEVAD